MVGYLDESYCENACIYIVAAVVPPTGEGRLRKALRAILPPGKGPYPPNFHWNSASPTAKTAIIQTALAHSTLGLYTFREIVVPSRQQEAARRRLINRFLAEAFSAVGGKRLVLDQRRGSFHAFDQQTLKGAVTGGVAPAGMTYSFRRPSAEPLLWIADALAGAVHARDEHKDDRFVNMLGGRLVEK